MAWFKKTRKPIAAKEKTSRVPEGLWVKCPGCSQIIYNKDLATNLNVCPKCAHHFRIGALERLRTLFDDGIWIEYDKGLVSTDPLQFTDTKPYKQRLAASSAATGLKDALIVGSGRIGGIPTIAAAMEYAFIGGSMGVVVGEKITRAAERALDERAPLIVVSCSGGALVTYPLPQRRGSESSLTASDQGVTGQQQRNCYRTVTSPSSQGVRNWAQKFCSAKQLLVVAG